MKVALYLRVSTELQDVETQRRDLRAYCERAKYTVVEEFVDEGVSGAKRVHRRPGGAALFSGIKARRFDMVAVWSVCRLGRTVIDLAGIVEELRSRKIELYVHKQQMDTTTPSGRLLFTICSAAAEFEREMTIDRTKASLAARRAKGLPMGARAWKSRTLPAVGEVEAAIRAELLDSTPIRRIPAAVKAKLGSGCSLTTVYAIKRELAALAAE